MGLLTIEKQKAHGFQNIVCNYWYALRLYPSDCRLSMGVEKRLLLALKAYRWQNENEFPGTRCR